MKIRKRLLCTSTLIKVQYVFFRPQTDTSTKKAKKQKTTDETEERPFACDSCEKTYRFKFLLNRHVKIVHSTEEKKFKCDQCPYQSHYAFDFKEHKMTHSGEVKYFCETCQIGFRGSQSYKNHMLKHSNKELPFKCQFCDKRYGTKGYVKVHEKTTHLHIKPIKCPKCDYRCAKKSELKHHLYTHDEDKPFPCDFCHCEFTTKRILTKHIEKRHPEMANK